MPICFLRTSVWHSDLILQPELVLVSQDEDRLKKKKKKCLPFKPIKLSPVL